MNISRTASLGSGSDDGEMIVIAARPPSNAKADFEVSIAALVDDLTEKFEAGSITKEEAQKIAKPLFDLLS